MVSTSVVLHKRKTSSLSRVKNVFVGNAILEFINGVIKSYLNMLTPTVRMDF